MPTKLWNYRIVWLMIVSVPGTSCLCARWEFAVCKSISADLWITLNGVVWKFHHSILRKFYVFLRWMFALNSLTDELFTLFNVWRTILKLLYQFTLRVIEMFREWTSLKEGKIDMCPWHWTSLHNSIEKKFKSQKMKRKKNPILLARKHKSELSASHQYLSKS